MPGHDHETADLSLDEFRSVAARDDDPDAHDTPAAEEDLHAVDPFVDPELLEAVETVDVDAIAAEVATRRRSGATSLDVDDDTEEPDDDRDHEAGVDEILDETTHSHDPAREVGWADDDVDDEPPAGAAIPEPRHADEFLCRSCFLLLPDRLRDTDDPTRCHDCAIEARAPR